MENHQQFPSRLTRVQESNIFLMELIFSYSSPLCLTTSTLYYHRNTLVLARKQCKRCKKDLLVLPSFMIISKFSDKQVIPRQSANYHPSIWDQKLIESLSTPYSVSPVNITLLFPIYYDTLTNHLFYHCLCFHITFVLSLG